MKHTVVAMVEDRPGVLTRVASLFRRRGFNIDSLAVGATEEQGISRMTIVVDGDHGILQQVEHQLFKLIDVVKVTNLSKEDAVSRELALIKVRCGTLHRREVLDIVEIFRAQVIDVSPATLIIHVVAEEERLNALLDNLKPYGVMEMVRTGRIAMARGEQTSAIRKEESDEVLRFHTESGRRPEGKLPYVSK